jgi:hypothetical protein
VIKTLVFKKNAIFSPKIAENCDHNIGLLRKTPFFRQKLGKIAENCDHNIGI